MPQGDGVAASAAEALNGFRFSPIRSDVIPMRRCDGIPSHPIPSYSFPSISIPSKSKLGAVFGARCQAACCWDQVTYLYTARDFSFHARSWSSNALITFFTILIKAFGFKYSFLFVSEGFTQLDSKLQTFR